MARHASSSINWRPSKRTGERWRPGRRRLILTKWSESTGIYWKSPYAALEAMGIRATVVNARHVKQVPERKTDVCDASGSRPWRVPVCCVGHSCRRPNGVNSG